MTENATKLVQPLTFETLSYRPVCVDTFSRTESWDVKHISLAQKAHIMVVAPATANIMAKMAHGIADDMLSTTVLATRATVLIAPAMNTGMWEAKATQENLKMLKARGVETVGPEGGFLACGDVGAGRMSEPVQIVEKITELLARKQDMTGLKVLVTAGPTREMLDPVRFVTNRSSGRMGYALAENAQQRGAEVTLVSGPVNIPAPKGVTVVNVQSTDDLYNAMMEFAPQQDIIVQSAAPADYKTENVAPQKLKKQGDAALELRLVPTQDVAKAVGENKKPGQTLIGFAAETENLHDNAEKKLDRKNLDMIVANDVTKPGAGFDVDTNIASIMTDDGVEELPLMKKTELAQVIFDRALTLRSK